MKTPEGLIDLTDKAKKGLVERPIGRDREITQIKNGLLQEGKSNILLLGPAGVGKTMLVEGLALDLINGEIESDGLKRIVELQLNTLMSGTMYRGQMEEKTKAVIDYILSRDDTVLFIDEIHMMIGFGATNESKGTDISQVLKPYLARGEVRCIGATTDVEFDKYVAPDPAFVRRFQLLTVGELGSNDTVEILKKMNIRNKFLKGSFLSEDSLFKIVEYSNAKMPMRRNPDKAIDVFKIFMQNIEPVCGVSVGNKKSLESNTGELEKARLSLERQLKNLKNKKYDDAIFVAKEFHGVSSKLCEEIKADLKDIEKAVLGEEVA